MKKKEILARYAELSNNRNEVASASANALTRIATDGDLTTSELAGVHSDIIFMASYDEENDQREIANLIAVANSDLFSDEDRSVARERVVIMLELR